ncbi:hypothetical protein BN2476_310040 [Paraburkholderia piptadeniae]|uniref:Uncharacterized protein n=2 Tax=Paraburkholderia piptadeniae TaxID=1701573 RepID=A0A1N7S3W9_9BURK|nr:hypothetical protein BN2476_310040 [Paraburkholderia piptadeniae]
MAGGQRAEGSYREVPAWRLASGETRRCACSVCAVRVSCSKVQEGMAWRLQFIPLHAPRMALAARRCFLPMSFDLLNRIVGRFFEIHQHMSETLICWDNVGIRAEAAAGQNNRSK